jgi:hypothetical protein
MLGNNEKRTIAFKMCKLQICSMVRAVIDKHLRRHFNGKSNKKFNEKFYGKSSGKFNGNNIKD